MSEKNYRKVLLDCVSTIAEYDGGMNKESIPDLHEEINRVYEETEILGMIKDILNNDDIDSIGQYARIYSVVQGYQLDLL